MSDYSVFFIKKSNSAYQATDPGTAFVPTTTTDRFVAYDYIKDVASSPETSYHVASEGDYRTYFSSDGSVYYKLVYIPQSYSHSQSGTKVTID